MNRGLMGFSLALGALLAGCGAKDDRHTMDSEGAVLAAGIIRTLGGAHADEIDVASFDRSLQAILPQLTNSCERARLAELYCGEMLRFDLLGPNAGLDASEANRRCAVVGGLLYRTRGLLMGLGKCEYDVLGFSVAMCAHLRQERVRAQKAIGIGGESGCTANGSQAFSRKLPEQIDDLRHRWIWQCIDMPKERWEQVFKGVSDDEKNAMKKRIEDEIGRPQNVF